MTTVMPTLRADLQRARGRWPQMATDTGVSHSTISRVARGRIPTPQIDTYLALRSWLDEHLPEQAAA